MHGCPPQSKYPGVLIIYRQGRNNDKVDMHIHILAKILKILGTLYS